MITNTSDDLNLDDKTVVVSYKKSKTLHVISPRKIGYKLDYVMKGWRMVKSKTCQDAEILVRNPSLRPFQKSKKQTMKKRDFKNASEISRSCQNFPRPTFFNVPFGTPS